MRALRVIGLDADGKSVICEDADRREQFRLPADEQLRAAARGDLTRLGQIEIELDSQLRPKDIQARIRAGATVEQVAATAGIPAQRVERYAHPVLLERSRAAQIAQGGHPVHPDGPSVQTLSQLVAAAFVQRGQDVAAAEWDAWRGEDNRWVVALRWTTGRSDNTALWRFQPGAHGGTITALDDAAADLVDPEPTRPLRPVNPVASVRPAGPPDAGKRAEETPTVGTATAGSATAESATAGPVTGSAAPEPESGPQAAPSSARPGKGQRPSMPSWEDVLLGVRSQRG